MKYGKKLIVICMTFSMQVLFSSQMKQDNYEQAAHALFEFSVAERQQEKTQALTRLQEEFKRASDTTKKDILATIRQSGFNPADLGIQELQQQQKVQPAQAPAESILSLYIPEELLKNFAPDKKARYLKLIEQAKREGDEGWVKFQIKRELESDQPRTKAPQKPPVASQPEQRRQAAQPSLDFMILTARTVGEGKHLWDCTWEVLKNASYLYKQLKNRKDIPQDISAAPYSEWCAKSHEYEKLQMQSDAMEDVINKNKLLGNDYAFVEGDVKQLSPDFILNMDTIKKIKNTPGAAFVFLVNPAGHWFTVVAHNAGGKVNYYIADDTPKPMATYKEIVQFLKGLIEK